MKCLHCGGRVFQWAPRPIDEDGEPGEIDEDHPDIFHRCDNCHAEEEFLDDLVISDE